MHIKLLNLFILIAINLAFIGCSPFTTPSSVTLSQTSSPAIEIYSVNPETSFTTGGLTVTITGKGFTSTSSSGTSVKLGQTACSSINVIDNNTLTCVVPPVSTTTTSVDLIIENEKGTSTLTSGFEYNTSALRSIELFAGELSYAGYTDGTSATAKFNHPAKPLVVGTDVYISDMGNHTIRKFDTVSGVVTTVIGTVGVSGTTDAIGTSAKLNHPTGMVKLGNDVFFADNGSCLIRKFDLTTYQVTTVAGIANQCGTIVNDAIGLQAQFAAPVGITTDGTNLFVADDTYIRKITLTGSNAVSQIFPGGTPNGAVSDLTLIGTELFFIHVATAGTSSIRKIDINTLTTTSVRSVQHKSGGLATDGTDLYISASASHRLQKLVLSGNVLTTPVGSTTAGNTDGIGTAATLYVPSQIDISSGYIYMTTLGSHNLKKINMTDFTVTTILGNTK